MRLAVCIAVLMGLTHWAAAEEHPPDLAIRAAAPLGLGESALGRPLSARFEPLIGKDGTSMFPAAKVVRNEAAAWWYEFEAFESLLELRANGRAWAVNVSGTAAVRKRFAVYRAVQITHVLELNDTIEPRPAPADAAYYMRKIYFGRVFEVVLSGSQEAFTANVRADLLAWSAGIDAAAKQYRLDTHIFAKGLKPKAQAIFAKSEIEIREQYAEDADYNAGKPVPVLVEYRRIPGADLGPSETVEWQPPRPSSSMIKVRQLRVEGTNSDWTSAEIAINEGDVIVGTADGSVTYNLLGDKAGADTRGTGGLEMQVGSKVIRAAKTWTHRGGAGEVKFKVTDGKHSDNKGGYEVEILVIPATALEAGECIRAGGPNRERCR